MREYRDRILDKFRDLSPEERHRVEKLLDALLDAYADEGPDGVSRVLGQRRDDVLREIRRLSAAVEAGE